MTDNLGTVPNGISRAAAAEEAKRQEAAERARRQREARKAVEGVQPPKPEDLCSYRVLKLGDGRISMGQHVAGVGDAYYEFGEIVTGVDREIAETLEERGWVEIQPAEPAARVSRPRRDEAVA